MYLVVHVLIIGKSVILEQFPYFLKIVESPFIFKTFQKKCFRLDCGAKLPYEGFCSELSSTQTCPVKEILLFARG